MSAPDISFISATEHFILCWAAVEIYFLLQGKEECFSLRWKFMEEEHLLHDDLALK